jgi:hypothetical protein
MRHHIIAISAAAFTFAVLSGVAFAEETKTVQRTVTVYSLKDAPELEKKVTAICTDANVKLSDKARAACESHNFPKMTKNKVFRNAGVGAEFNTLANQRN